MPGGKAAATAWDPSTATDLAGWYQSSFAIPWPTTNVSTTVSSMVTHGSDPTNGPILNGHQTAQFNGTANCLESGTDHGSGQLTTILGTTLTGYTFGVLCRIISVTDDDATLYQNPGIVADNGGYWGIYTRDHSGSPQVFLLHWHGVSTIVAANVSTGTWFAIFGGWDKTNLIVDVGGGPQTTASVGPSSTSGNYFFGGSGVSGASSHSNVDIADVIFANTTGSFTRAEYLSYANARYGLSLT